MSINEISQSSRVAGSESIEESSEKNLLNRELRGQSVGNVLAGPVQKTASYFEEATRYVESRMKSSEERSEQEDRDLALSLIFARYDHLELQHRSDPSVLSRERAVLPKKEEEGKKATNVAHTASSASAPSSRAREMRRPIPRGIPNSKSSCFLISAYQFVKGNPRLYNAIFNSENFKKDRRFDALRTFDNRYTAGQTITAADTLRMRTGCFTQLGITPEGIGDAFEALSRALFIHLPMTSSIQSRAFYEFSIPAHQVDAALRKMEGVEVVSRTLKPATSSLGEDQVTVRVRKNFRPEPLSSVVVNMHKAPWGARLEEFIVQGHSEGRGEALKLSEDILGRQTERECTLTPGQGIVIALNRFDHRGNKINKQISVPNGEVHLGGERAHQIKGFIVHVGGSNFSGHYIAYQKTGDQWYAADDSRVNPVTTAEAQRAMRNSYVLYAERA
jgi:hypothetical protein